MSPWEASTGITQQGPRAGRPCSPVPALTVSHAGCGRRSEVPGGLPLAGAPGPSPITLGLAGTSKNLPWSWPSPSTCPTPGARTYRCSSGSRIAESRPARVSLGDTGGQSGQVQWKNVETKPAGLDWGRWGGGIPWGQAVPNLRGDQHHQGLPEIPENRKEARSRHRGGLTSSCSDPQANSQGTQLNLLQYYSDVITILFLMWR